MICGTNARGTPVTLVELLVSPSSTMYENGATPSGTVTAVYSNGTEIDVTAEAAMSVSSIAYNTTEVIFSYEDLSVSQTVSNVTYTLFYNSAITWSGFQSGGSAGAHSISTTQIYMANGNNGGYGYRATSVNLSQWNYISVTYTISTSISTDTFFKVKYAAGNAWNTDYDIISITNSASVTNATRKQALTSGLGNRQIQIAAHSYSSASGGFKVYVTKVVLSRL